MTRSEVALRSVGVITICSFLQLVLQFVIQLVLAKQYGTSDDMDAYRAAMTLPTVLSAVLILPIGTAFVPVYLQCRQEESERSAHQLATQLGLLIIFVCTLLGLLGLLFAKPLMQHLHPGFDIDQVARTASLFRILTWLVVTNGLTSYFNALFHSVKRFRTPAFAGVIGVAGTLGLLILQPLGSSIEAVAMAVLLGSVITILLQSHLFLRQFVFRINAHNALRRVFYVLLPLYGAALTMHIGNLVDKYITSETPSTISKLSWAWQIVTALITLASTGLSVAVFPTLASQQLANQKEKFVAEFAHGARFLAIVVIPICLWMGIFSKYVIRDVYQRGEFTAADTQTVALLLTIYLGVVIGSSYGTLCGTVFIALQKTYVPMWIGLVGTVIAIVLKFQFGREEAYGAVGIASVTTGKYFYLVIVSLIILHRWYGNGLWYGFAGTAIRACSASVITVLVSSAIILQPIQYSSVLAAPVAVSLYILLMYLFRDEFARRLVHYLFSVWPLRSAQRSANQEHNSDSS